MNRTEALLAMLDGLEVRSIDPFYLTRNEHGGNFSFRYDFDLKQIVWNRGLTWRPCNRAFWSLSHEFELTQKREGEND